MTTIRHTRPTPRGLRPGADEALARLLADAAPEHDYGRELRGEADAVTAFREARHAPPSPSRKRSVNAGKLLVIKLVIVVAGLSGGSVAFATVVRHATGGHPSAPSSVAPAVSPHAAATGGGHPRNSAKVPAAGASPASAAGKPTKGPLGQPTAHSAGGATARHPDVQSAAPPATQPAGAPDIGVGASAGPVRLPGTPAGVPVNASLSPAVEPTLPAAGVP